jgi:hypothetical protein
MKPFETVSFSSSSRNLFTSLKRGANEIIHLAESRVLVRETSLSLAFRSALQKPARMFHDILHIESQFLERDFPGG